MSVKLLLLCTWNEEITVSLDDQRTGGFASQTVDAETGAPIANETGKLKVKLEGDDNSEY